MLAGWRGNSQTRVRTGDICWQADSSIRPRSGDGFRMRGWEANTRVRSAVDRVGNETMSLEYVDWDIGEVTVINLTGRITLGQGTQRLRQSILEVLDRGRRHILLNFDEIFYVDSSGLGELVASRKKVVESGGNLKLMKLNKITRDLIQITKLYSVFEVFNDEASALKSFKEPAAPADLGPGVPRS